MACATRHAKILLAAFAAVLLGASPAFAASTGIDTTPGASGTSLTFSIQGAEKMRLTANGLIIDMGAYPQGLSFSANQIWTTSGTLYLQGLPEIPAFSVVIGTSTSTATNNDLYIHGGLVTEKTLPMVDPTDVQILNWGASPGVTSNWGTFGGSPQIFVNGNDYTGGGMLISDDGGFYDYNDGWITYNGSNGLKVAGNSGPASAGTVTVIGWLCLNTTTACVRNLDGGTIEGEFGSGAIPGTHSICSMAYQDAGPKGGDVQIRITGGVPGAYTWYVDNNSVSGSPNPYYMGGLTISCMD